MQDVHNKVVSSEQVWHVVFVHDTQLSLAKAPDMQLQVPSG